MRYEWDARPSTASARRGINVRVDAEGYHEAKATVLEILGEVPTNTAQFSEWNIILLSITETGKLRKAVK